ncbi:hypothetical protein [Burkholderia cepacia]|uniref:hypothetical protein n=1 Tax=Burkholderia cepacia TaxID=292 RepID=UPI000F5F7C99|nr:hypothetical protein [Burkholderia cepacia]RRA01872.1 hypothetical protein DF055_19825 [Burkholderia cepacia]RRA04904.1 hypothetical protein DF054_22625 [Burkholderia cepacia]
MKSTDDMLTEMEPIVSQWIRERGTCMDGASYAAALELAAFVAIHRTMPDGEAWRPIETAPADTEVVVFWLDPESPEHPERYDFDMLDDGCWRQWTDHYEWAHSVAPAGSRLPREQPPYTHWKPLGTPTRAIDATHSGT